MKAFDKIAILCSVLTVLAACQKVKLIPPAPDNPIPQKADVTPETRTLTFVLPDYPVGEDEAVAPGLKTAWAAGDQIVIHGEYAEDQVTVTLAAGDISADGKTATQTVSGLKPYSRSDCASSLYAAYPAQAVNTLTHCMFYTSFINTNTQIIAAYNQEDTFRFKNLSGVVSFVVSGDFDSYTFTGRKDVMLDYEVFQVKLTDTESEVGQYLQSPSTTIKSSNLVADGETVNYVYVPGDVDLHGGFILRFFKDGEAIKSLTDKQAVQLPMGTGLVLGDVTSRLVDAADDIDPSLATPLDNKGHANSYVLFEPGLYRFAAVEGNSDTAIKGVASASLVWETYGNTEEVVAHSLISGISYDAESGVVCFEVHAPYLGGNALIAVKDAEDVILWSWHIWAPKTAISSGTYGFKGTIMDRNLGALVAANEEVSDPQSCGLFYQWGRKDPLRAIGSMEEPIPATTAPADVWSSETGQATLEQARKHPTVMYLDKVWTSDDPTDLWAAAKSVNDPCPPGWKVPDNSGIFEGYWDIPSNGWGTYGFVAGAGSASSNVFPYSGFVSYSSGSITLAETEGKITRLWDIVAYSSAGKYRALQIRSDKSRNGTGNDMGYAYGIRCTQDI